MSTFFISTFSQKNMNTDDVQTASLIVDPLPKNTAPDVIPAKNFK